MASASPGRSRVVGGAANTSTPAHQGDVFPIYTYLLNAGLSPADVRSAGDEIRRRVRERIKQKAMGDDPEEQRRYLTDHSHRHQVNAQIVGEVVLGMGFETAELRKIDAGLRLGLASRPERSGPLVARATDVDGTPEDFEILQNDGTGTVLRSKKDGQVYRF